MLLRKYILSILVLGSFFGTSFGFEIRDEFLKTKECENVQLLYSDDSFTVLDEDRNYTVINKMFVDKELRGLTEETLQFALGIKSLVKIGDEEMILSKISPSEALKKKEKSDNFDMDITAKDKEEIVRSSVKTSYIELYYDGNDYHVRIKHSLPGGGFFGATFGAYAGKFIVSGVCHGTIAIISVGVGAVATPAAGTAMFYTLESTFGATIESVSVTGAFIGGITGMVATGPA